MSRKKNQNMSSKGKRSQRNISNTEKLVAIGRIHDGESKASVARDIGVPESTLRGWFKAEAKIRGSMPPSPNGERSLSGEPSDKRRRYNVEPLPYNGIDNTSTNMTPNYTISGNGSLDLSLINQKPSTLTPSDFSINYSKSPRSRTGINKPDNSARSELSATAGYPQPSMSHMSGLTSVTSPSRLPNASIDYIMKQYVTAFTSMMKATPNSSTSSSNSLRDVRPMRSSQLPADANLLPLLGNSLNASDTRNRRLASEQNVPDQTYFTFIQNNPAMVPFLSTLLSNPSFAQGLPFNPRGSLHAPAYSGITRKTESSSPPLTLRNSGTSTPLPSVSPNAAASVIATASPTVSPIAVASPSSLPNSTTSSSPDTIAVPSKSPDSSTTASTSASASASATSVDAQSTATLAPTPTLAPTLTKPKKRSLSAIYAQTVPLEATSESNILFSQLTKGKNDFDAQTENLYAKNTINNDEFSNARSPNSKARIALDNIVCHNNNYKNVVNDENVINVANIDTAKQSTVSSTEAVKCGETFLSYLEAQESNPLVSTTQLTVIKNLLHKIKNYVKPVENGVIDKPRRRRK